MSWTKITKNNQYVCMDAVKIVSFPADLVSATQQANNNGLTNILLSVCQIANIIPSFEIIWASGRRDNGQNNIHIYIIIRLFGNDDVFLKANLKIIIENLTVILRSGGYGLEINTDLKIIEKDFYTINDRGACCLHRIPYNLQLGSMYSAVPYLKPFTKPLFDTDEVCLHLSKYDNSAIIIDLFPETLNTNDLYNYNYFYSLISQHREEFRPSIDDAKKYYELISNSNGHLFTFNIFILSSKDGALDISNNICSSYNLNNSVYDAIKPVNLGNITYSSLDLFSLPWEYKKIIHHRLHDEYGNTYTLPTKGFNIITKSEIEKLTVLPIKASNVSLLKNTIILFSDNLKNIDNTNSIIIGKSFSELGQIDIKYNINDLMRHALIVGMSGFGKTTLLKNVLLQLAKKDVSFLVIDPVKKEYRSLLKYDNDIVFYTPGNSELSPLLINPFIPPEGVSIEKYIPYLMDSFRIAFTLESPLDVIMLKTIRETYILNGWKEYSKLGDPDVSVFGIMEFIAEFRRNIEESNYSREVKGNLTSAGIFRFLELVEQNRMIFDTNNSCSIRELLNQKSVIELDDIYSDEQKALIISFILANCYLYTKENRESGQKELKNIILLDEAHTLIDTKREDNSKKIKAVNNLFSSLTKEIRSYGTGIVIADQSFLSVGKSISSMTDLKIAFRLSDEEEKNEFINSVNSDHNMISMLSTLKKGEAAIYSSSFDTAQFIETDNIFANDKTSLSFENLIKNNSFPIMPFKECSHSCTSCDSKYRKESCYYADKLFLTHSNTIKNKDDALKLLLMVPELIKENDIIKKTILLNCISLHLARKIMGEKGIFIKKSELSWIVQQGGTV